MISNPYEHEHPLFHGKREYTLERAILDTGDAANEATALLSFRHRSGRIRTFRFSGIGLAAGCGAIANLRGYLPVYVASLAGRGWESSTQIEVGDTDPGGVWFWAEAMAETTEPNSPAVGPMPSL
jgi:hypothetical protein